MLLDSVGVQLEGLALCHVETVGLDRDTDRLEAFLGDRQSLGVDIADRHTGARAAEFDGQRLPDTRSRPRDDGNFPGEALHAPTPVVTNCCSIVFDLSRYRRYRRRPGRPVVHECGDQVGELVGPLDLRHVPGVGEQVDLCGGEVPPGRLEVGRGQDPVAVAPDQQGGAGVRGHGRQQFRAPLRSYPAGGAEMIGDLQQERAGAGLCGDPQRMRDAFGGGQCRIGEDPAFHQPGAGGGAVRRGVPPQTGQGQHAQQRGDLGAETRAVDQGQAGDPVGVGCQQLHGDRTAERIADDVAGPGLTEFGQDARHAVGQGRQVGGSVPARREPETRLIRRDHVEAPRQSLHLFGPVLQAAGDAVQQEQRRALPITCCLDPDGTVIDSQQAHPTMM